MTKDSSTDERPDGDIPYVDTKVYFSLGLGLLIIGIALSISVAWYLGLALIVFGALQIFRGLQQLRAESEAQ